MRAVATLVAIVALGVCLALLRRCGDDDRRFAGYRARDAQDEQFATRRREALQKSALPILADSLRAESERWIEPWNSPAYRIMIARSPGDLHELRRLILADSADARSLLGMLALRAAARSVFDSIPVSFRVAILADVLARDPTMNVFGMAGHWEDAGLAFIEEGSATRSVALARLADLGPAPLWGSLSATEVNDLQLRRRDFAWFLLRAWDHGLPPLYALTDSIPSRRVQRDSLIRAEYGR